MDRAAARLVTVRRRHLREVINVGLPFLLSRLRQRPRPHVPRHLVVEALHLRGVRLGVGARRVDLQELGGAIGEAILDLRREFRRGSLRHAEEREAGLVLVRPDEHVEVRLPALRIGRRQILGDVPPVHDRTAAGHLHDLVGRFGAQVGERGGADLRGRVPAGLLRLGQCHHLLHPHARPRRALRDDAMIEPAAFLRAGQHRLERRAGGLADEGHAPRIPAERRDVRLHPLERGGQVHDTVVAGRVAPGLLRQLRMRVEPERPEAVVVGDEDDALLRERFAVIAWQRAGPAGERAAIAPDHHGQLRRGGRGGGPDVDVEAIFACRRRRRCAFAPASTAATALHAARAEGLGLAHAVPFRRGLRRLPAQRADRRRGEGDALEHAHVRVVAGDARDEPPVGFHRLGDGPRRHAGDQEQSSCYQRLFHDCPLVRKACTTSAPYRPHAMRSACCADRSSLRGTRIRRSRSPASRPDRARPSIVPSTSPGRRP